jgi:CRP-like cAMP-binding protein
MAVPYPAEGRFLACLPRRERERLLAALQPVQLTCKQIVQLSGEPSQMVYFPLTAVLSLVGTLTDGSSAELVTVGNEGMAGLSAVLGYEETQPFEMTVLIAGTALRMPSSALAREARLSAPLEDLLLRYVKVLLDQIAQEVLCRGHHSVRQRLAKSLLAIGDQVHACQFPVTQELLGRMLDVGRPRVSLAADAFRQSGLIHYRRGQIDLLDLPALEAVACECYQIVRDRLVRLLSHAPGPYISELKWPQTDNTLS